MKQYRVILVLWMIAAFVCSTYPAHTAQSDEHKAVTSAGEWLNLIDTGDFDKSWDEAAKFFKEAVPKNQWIASMKTFRSPLGKLISRRLKSKKYATSLPGVPDGKYVVIQFDTSFQNKQSAVETVTPVLEKDGSWRVSGYYIK